MKLIIFWEGSDAQHNSRYEVFKSRPALGLTRNWDLAEHDKYLAVPLNVYSMLTAWSTASKLKKLSLNQSGYCM